MYTFFELTIKLQKYTVSEIIVSVHFYILFIENRNFIKKNRS